MTSTSNTPGRAHQRRALAAALLAGVLLAGCGLQDPAARYYTPTPAGSVTVADPTPAPERDGTIPQTAAPRPAAAAGAVSAAAALERYATLACDWTAADVVARQQRLAGQAVGQARTNALQALQELSVDRTLASDAIVNRCRIVSIAAGRGPAAGEWVLVLSQSTRGRGSYSNLPAALHIIYANVRHGAGGYLVSQWSAQS